MEQENNQTIDMKKLFDDYKDEIIEILLQCADDVSRIIDEYNPEGGTRRKYSEPGDRSKIQSLSFIFDLILRRLQRHVKNDHALEMKQHCPEFAHLVKRAYDNVNQHREATS